MVLTDAAPVKVFIECMGTLTGRVTANKGFSLGGLGCQRLFGDVGEQEDGDANGTLGKE